MHGVNRSVRGVRGGRRPDRGIDDSEPDLLALHITAALGCGCGLIDTQLRKLRVATLFAPVRDCYAREEKQSHRGKQRPALPPVSGHFPKSVSQAGAQREKRYRLEQVGQRSGVLIRMCRVGVEKTSAIGPELLDRDLR